jgi:carbon monoxide dehydrogenase subunit G
MRIEIIESENLNYIKARASGNDSKVGSRMKVDLDVRLRQNGENTTLSFEASVDILGKLAALGHSMIRRKADQVMDEFAEAVKKQMQGDSANA